MRNATVPASVPSTWHGGTEELKLLLRATSVPPEQKSVCYQLVSRSIQEFHYDGKIKATSGFEDRAEWVYDRPLVFGLFSITGLIPRFFE
jgi:hypothetical protein